MEAIDIVEALNQYHEELGMEGQFILQKKLENNPTVKAYKTCSFTIWFMKGNKKEKVVAATYTGRLVSEKEIESVNNRMCIELTKAVFKFITGNDYMKLVYGI